MGIIINKIHNYISNKINISQHLYKKSILIGICSYLTLLIIGLIYFSIFDPTELRPRDRRREISNVFTIVLSPLFENIILVLYFKLTGFLLKYQYLFLYYLSLLYLDMHIMCS